MALRRRIGRAAATSAAARRMAAAKATQKASAQSVGSESVGGQSVSRCDRLSLSDLGPTVPKGTIYALNPLLDLLLVT